MIPMCDETTMPTWSSTANAFQCSGTSVQCPAQATSPEPTLIMSTKCTDGSVPACVQQATCQSGATPDVPVGFELKTLYNNGWQTIGYNPSTGQISPSPVCDYFGLKQTDACACSCIVDSSGVPINEGPATIQADGNPGCSDPNTKMNCQSP